MLTKNGNDISVSDTRHKYGSAMAEYLDQTEPDRSGGDVDGPGGAYSQFGKWMLYENSQGFVDADKHPTVAGATATADALDQEWSDWMSEGEEYYD